MPDEKPSEHLDEFQRRVESYKRKGGSMAMVWMAIDDLGRQVSDVRHNQGNMIMSHENLNTKLFGWKDIPDPSLGVQGGIFGKLTDDIQKTKEEVTTQINLQTQELKDNNRWVLRLGGGILTGVLALVAEVVVQNWPKH